MITRSHKDSEQNPAYRSTSPWWGLSIKGQFYKESSEDTEEGNRRLIPFLSNLTRVIRVLGFDAPQWHNR